MSRLAFVFPGQGSHFIGMGQDIARSCPPAREVLEMADRAVGFPLSDLMANGPSEVLRQTVNTQPAVVTHSLAVLAAVRARGRARCPWSWGRSTSIPGSMPCRSGRRKGI